ncbi:hypothetical protein MUN82_09870 [Hymenobacter aerilatus]|uniref:Integrase catalytic domain-containing protein n=1 Tax=Hymenobacter aerilatus TaxID=2932251 RepID=A0A8T9T0L2_9BACT|nr:hypothetical protein [Hymenobacter aerilatus]UOR07387.1 hypothetical protein MUN82_09870 [Hymenobacter aerilatus]
MPAKLQAQALASYSRPGNPYDNAQAEADWSTLKTELLPHGGAFASLGRLLPRHLLQTRPTLLRPRLLLALPVRT